MERKRVYDKIINRLTEIMNAAINQVSKATSLQACASIFTDARTKILSEILAAKRMIGTKEITKDEYSSIAMRGAVSQMYIIDAIKKRMFQMLDEEAIKLSKI